MAIAHDTTTTAAAYTSTGTQTTSHAASASARGAVVLIDQNGAITDQVSGVTYGGVDMKRLRFDTENTEAGGVYIYWLDEVPTGTQDVAMTTTGTASKQLSVSTMTVASGKVIRPVGTGDTATSASAANPALTLSGLTAGVVYAAYEVIHSGLTTMTNTPQTSPAWTLISSTDLGAQGRGFARITNTPGGTTITAGWIAATADDYVISGVAFYETDPPSADGLPNSGLAAWWAADDLSLADNDPVTSWADRVTGLALAEATNPPTFKTAILNGLPAVRFSTAGTDESLQTAATVPLFNSVRGGTVFVVAKSTAPQATFQTFFATDTATSGTDRFSCYATSTDGYLGQYGRRLDGDALTSKPSTTVAPSAAGIIRAVSDWGAGTYDLDLDGAAVGSGAYTSAGTTSFTNASKFRVGRSGTATYGLEGDIYEVIVYERVLTSGEITTVENYLNAKWLGGGVTDKNDTDTAAATDASSARAAITTDTSTASDGPTERAATTTDTAAAADAVLALDQGTTQKSDTDTAAATDTITARTSTSGDAGTATDTAGGPTAALASSDTVAGTDTVAARSIGAPDTAAATDTAALAASGSSTDAAAATDASTALAATLSGTDTAAVTDAATALTAALTGTDTAAATDAVQTLDQGTTQKSDSDAAAATDTVTGRASTSPDTAGATDAPTSRGITSSETSSGTDATTVRALTTTDAANATDTTSPLAAALTSSDTAAATDTATALTAVLSSTDTAAATDAVQTLDQGTTQKSDSDAAAATDTVTVRQLTAADSATAADAPAARTATSTDTAAAAEAVALAVTVTATDLATSAEASALAALLTAIDTAAGTDAAGARATATSDTATWVDDVIGRILDAHESATATEGATLAQVVSLTPRPSSGITANPSGSTPRPFESTSSAVDAGVTARPYSSTTPQP